MQIKNKLQISREQSQLLHFLRAISAILVVISHIFQILYLPLVGIESPVTTVFINLGWFSVATFFIMSGFIIGSYINNMEDDSTLKFEYKYLKSRVLRLLPPLMVTLLICLVLHFLLLLYFPYLSYDFTINDNSYPIRNAIPFEFSEYVASLFFLQMFLSEPVVINGPLWSLSYEFWFYFIALAICRFNINIITSAIMFVLFFIIVSIAYEPWKFISGMIIWFSGFLIANKDNPPKKNYIILFLLLNISYVYVLRGSDSLTLNLIIKTLISLCLCAFFYFFVFKSDININKFSFAPNIISVAKYSYTLYLLHFPFILATYILIDNFFLFDYVYIVPFSIFVFCLTIYISKFIGTTVESKDLILRILNVLKK